MLSANFKPKRTAAASRGFLATARLSCFKVRAIRCHSVTIWYSLLLAFNYGNNIRYFRPTCESDALWVVGKSKDRWRRPLHPGFSAQFEGRRSKRGGPVYSGFHLIRTLNILPSWKCLYVKNASMLNRRDIKRQWGRSSCAHAAVACWSLFAVCVTHLPDVDFGGDRK